MSLGVVYALIESGNLVPTPQVIVPFVGLARLVFMVRGATPVSP
jgi:hypothetical protein